MKQQLRVVMKKYGKIAAAFHASMFAATFGASYGVIRSGVDVKTFLDRIPMVDARKVDASAGSLACAYIATLATGPARGLLTITATPMLARLLARIRR